MIRSRLAGEPAARGAPIIGGPRHGLSAMSGCAEFTPSARCALPSIHREAELIPFPRPAGFPFADEEAVRPAPRTTVLFVCRTHAVLSPMAEGLARAAYERLEISVQSAGLTAGPIDRRAVAAMAEIGIDISQTPASSVRDLDLGSFEIVVSVGIHKLGLEGRQLAIAWDVPEFTRVTERTALPRMRAVRDALAVRVRALGAILTATSRA